MPYRKLVFANQEIYHILNRGVAQKPTFLSKSDYLRFLTITDFYRYLKPRLSFSHYNRLFKKEKLIFLKNLKEKNQLLVEILAFCFMPNHFHFLLKQLRDRGIPTMLSNIQNSYARHFNTKNKRNGPLFQPMFKAIRIETNEQLLHVSRYIHLNPSSFYLVKIGNLLSYPWSSLPEYLGLQDPAFTNPKLILDNFKDKQDYKKFVLDRADYQRELEKIKHLTFKEL